MNIILCGLPGTGKTTLSKMVASKFGLMYIADYTILGETSDKSALIKFINSNDNYVVDLFYSLSPKECMKLKNSIIYFLGFVSIDENLLLTLMTQKGVKITLEQIIENKKLCKKYQKDCKQLSIPFYDINRDRKEILDEIMGEIEKKIKG